VNLLLCGFTRPKSLFELSLLGSYSSFASKHIGRSLLESYSSFASKHICWLKSARRL
jgi:hypothetical protein